MLVPAAALAVLSFGIFATTFPLAQMVLYAAASLAALEVGYFVGSVLDLSLGEAAGRLHTGYAGSGPA